MQIVQSQQKSYVDNGRKDLEFEVGDMIFFESCFNERSHEVWEKKGQIEH